MTDRDSEARQEEIVAFLADGATHGGTAPETVETHAARLFLAGDEAYKLKRAVRFPFLDFTSMEERERVCRREIELNRRTAPGIYLDCLPVTRQADGGLAIDGEGEPVDWLVHMRRFDASATLDHLAGGEALPIDLVDALADEVVALHLGAEPAETDKADEEVASVAEGNLEEIATAGDIFDQAKAARLADLTRAALERNRELIRDRAAAGAVRRCHGDLHLGNIVLIDGRPVIFDALEFDEALATTDILYDLAFLVMDCWERGDRAAANRILNRWLSRRRCAEDLEGLALLPLFLSMRAAIRAKVAAARASGRDGEDAAEARRYLDAALEALAPVRPVLVAVGGFSGSGKSSVARGLAPRFAPPPGAIVVRSDEIRKELAGVGETDRLPGSAYSPSMSRRVYAEMWSRAGRVLASGLSAVADAVHGTAEERTEIVKVAAGAGAGFAGVWLQAPQALLSARVEARRNDASDATAGVVADQMSHLGEPEDWAKVMNDTTLEAATERALAATAGAGESSG